MPTVGIERRCLDETGNPFGHSTSRIVEVAAEQAYRAGVTPHQSKEHAHQRRLPGAIRTEQTVQPSGVGDQIHAAQRLAFAEPLRDAGEFQRGAIAHAGGS